MNKTGVRNNNVFTVASGNPSLLKERDLVRPSFLRFAELVGRLGILFFSMKILKFNPYPRVRFPNNDNTFGSVLMMILFHNMN